jgi:hypothetical protein
VIIVKGAQSTQFITDSGARPSTHLRRKILPTFDVVPTTVPVGVQEEFAQLYREARELKRQAASFLEQAKELVEELVRAG